MQIYDMPPDTKEKEKIIGGVLNINQFGWLLLGLAGFLAVVLSFFKYFGGVVFFFGLPFLIIGIAFAMVKKREMTLFKYLRYKKRYKKSIKFYRNKQVHEHISIFSEMN